MVTALLTLAACGGGLALQWTPASEGPETWVDARRGVWWGLATLGAEPDEDAVRREEGDGLTTFTVDVDRLRFPNPAPFQAAYDDLAAVQTPVEVGQLFLATVYEPTAYYTITGTPPDLASWDAAHATPDPQTFTVEHSSVSYGARAITLDGNASSFHVSSEEYDGSHEALDVLPNGVMRFAVYDADDRLAPEVDPLIAVAGGPGACMSCHFGKLLHTFDQVPEDAAFDALIVERQHALDDAHATMTGALDFADDTPNQFEGLVMPFVNGFPP